MDGKLVAAGSPRVQLDLESGPHTIRVDSPGGGLTVTREFVFEAGRSYQLDLLMDLVAR